MEKLKNKYEIILGFVTIVISYSAFKDELSRIQLNLGYATITAAQYFLYCVFGFSLCLYFYITEKIFVDTKIGTWKLWTHLIKVGFFIFVSILLSPILICINCVIFFLITEFLNSKEKKEAIIHILSSLSSILAIIVSLLTSLKIQKARKDEMQDKLQSQTIIELDRANRLYNDSYYSNSILESFKVLETFLYLKITEKDIRIQRHNFLEIIRVAKREGILTQTQFDYIRHLREMRNEAAHLNIDFDKEEAKKALEFVQEIIKQLNNH